MNQKNRLFEAGKIIIGSLIFIAFVIYIFRHVLTNPGLAPGADVVAYAHTTKIIIDHLKETYRLPPIDLSWYAGFENQALPPMVYFFLGLIYIITQNIELTTGIFHTMGIIIFYFVMFYVLKKEKFPTLNAWLGATAYAFMPIIFLSFYSYTKFSALFVLPVLFYFTNQVLTQKEHPYRYLGFLAIAMAIAIYSHPMSGIVFACSLAIYSIIYAYLDSSIVTRRIFLVIIGLFAGFILASSYVIPFVLEKTNRTTIAPEETFYKINLFAKADARMIGTINIKANIKTLGGWIIVFLMPLYVILRYRQAKLTAVYLTGFLTILISFAYVFLPIGYFFPFKLTYAYIWTYFTAFSLAYLFGLVIFSKSQKNWRLILGSMIIGLFFIFIYYASTFGEIQFYRLSNQGRFPGEIKLAKFLNNYSNKGRVIESHYPLGEIGYPLWVYQDHPDVEGHYFGIARIGRQIAFINDAIHNDYPEYVLKKLKNFNVRFFIGNRILYEMQSPKDEDYVGQNLLGKIQSAGYKLVYKINAQDTEKDTPGDQKYWLYYLDSPSTYIQPIQSDALVIGKYGSTLGAAVSTANINLIEGGSNYLDDYDLEFLRHFQTVILYGFAYRDKNQAENLVRDYVKSGGNLIIELWGMENSKLEENPSFLGVTGNRKKITNPIAIQTADKFRNFVPDRFDLPGEIIDNTKMLERLSYQKMKEWNALQYLNLDQSWANLSGEENDYSVLGFKEIEGKKVTFVGLNIFYHLYLTHDEKELNLLKYLINSDNLNKNGLGQKITVTDEKLTANNLKFEFTADKEDLAMISFAYSPHWQAYIDGLPIKIYHIEDLMVVNLPDGKHTLEIKYRQTTVKLAGNILSVLSLILIIFIIYFDNRRRKGVA